MFQLKAGTQILVLAPFGKVNGPQSVVSGDQVFTDTAPFKAHVCKRDTLLDKSEVIDAVALHNGREDVKPWIARNIELGYSVVQHNGVTALVRPNQLTFLE